jgi:hypothetical protein
VIDPALINKLEASRQELSSAIRRHAVQDVTHPSTAGWSARDVAAHLAACEVECFEPRIRAIAESNRPRFGFYSNDDRDFSRVRLDDALAEWAVTRARLVDFARSLSPDELMRVGAHAKFGEITVSRYLGIALEHDHDHLRDLEHGASEPVR